MTVKRPGRFFDKAVIYKKNIHTAVDALQGVSKIPPFWLLAWTALQGFLAAKNISDKSFAYLKELSSSEVVSDYTHRLFPEILKIKNADSHFATLDSFLEAAYNGRLPNFSYIEPEWTIGESGTGRRPGPIIGHFII